MNLEETIHRLDEAGKKAINQAKKCYILRASSAYNCQHITSFIKYITDNPNIKYPPDADKTFLEIEKTIEKFVLFLTGLDSEHWFQTIRAWQMTEINNLSEVFPQTFAESIKKLGIDPEKAIPTNPEQEKVDKRSDLSKIRKRLNRWLKDPENKDNILQDDIKAKVEIFTEVEGNKSEIDKIMQVNFSSLNIDNEDIKLNDKDADNHLGAGGFGTVCKATRLSTSEIVAVKEIRGDKLSPNSWSSIFAEILAMHKINHPYVLQLVGAHITEPYRIISRYCSGRSLFDRLHRRNNNFAPLSPTTLTKIAYQVASGMDYLHKNKIVHRDLKTLNILLDGDDNACIADFGLSHTMKDDEEFGETVGTPHYTAPEILVRTHYGPKVDIYSYAIVLWEMLTKRVPFSDMLPHSIIDHVVTCGWRLPIPNDASPELQKLITQCWSKDPNDRPDFSQIVPLFENHTIMFPESEIIDYEALRNECRCPPINVEYAVKVMKDPNDPNFGSVTRFIADRTDQKVSTILREANVLESMVSSTHDFGAILLLAGKVLNTADAFDNFLKSGGLNMYFKAISNDKEVKDAVEFGIAVPDDLFDQIEGSLPGIVEVLKKTRPIQFPILRFLARFAPRSLSPHKKDICAAILEAAETVGEFKDDDFEAVISLFEACDDGFRPEDIPTFYPLVSCRFGVGLSFVTRLVRASKEEFFPKLVLHLLEALKYSQLSDYVVNLLTEKETVFVTLWREEGLFNTLQDLLRKKLYTAPLLTMFCISKYHDAAMALSENNDLLEELFEMDLNNEMRLQILTALTRFEDFCQTTKQTDNIIHLLASDLMDDRFRDYSVRLISAMSSHQTGCKTLAENGVFLPFVQLFLSSSLGDSSAAYAILRNAVNFQAEIPQVPLIVSCLMQATMFEMARKEEILDTLIVLVQKMQGSVQEHDLKNVILPQLTRDAVPIVYRSLRLFSVCETTKLTPISSELLSAINEILNDPGKAYPCIIEAAVRTLEVIQMRGEINVFLEKTKLLSYLEKVVKLFPAKEAESRKYIEYFIRSFDRTKAGSFPIKISLPSGTRERRDSLSFRNIGPGIALSKK